MLMKTSSRVRLLIGVSIAICVCGVLYRQLASLDGFGGVFGALIDPPDTAYAAGYSDKEFSALQPGMSQTEVVKRIGAPLEQTWVYGCYTVAFAWNGKQYQSSPRGCAVKAIAGTPTREEVLRLRGEPKTMVWLYSVSPSRSSYRVRAIWLEDGRVVRKDASYYFS